MENNDELEYYLSIREGKDYIVYESYPYRLEEIDLINLIKICLVEERSKSIGKRLLEVYRDSTKHREEITIEKLKRMGINLDNEKKQPKTIRKPKSI